MIAVNLNGDIVGKHFSGRAARPTLANPLLARLSAGWQAMLGNNNHDREERPAADEPPGLFDVIAGSINIMQDRITRARMAGDPPDVVLAPRLAHLGLMDFDQASAAITAGLECVRLHLPLVQNVLNLPEVEN